MIKACSREPFLVSTIQLDGEGNVQLTSNVQGEIIFKDTASETFVKLYDSLLGSGVTNPATLFEIGVSDWVPVNHPDTNQNMFRFTADHDIETTNSYSLLTEFYQGSSSSVTKISGFDEVKLTTTQIIIRSTNPINMFAIVKKV